MLEKLEASSALLRTLELVLFVFAKPAAQTEEESFAIFKKESEKTKDIETLVAMRFGDFKTAVRDDRGVGGFLRFKGCNSSWS